MQYRTRTVDELLKQKMEAFGAVVITGVKGCGKTTTAKQLANSVCEFQDEDVRDNLLLIADTKPSDLLIGARPRLFDEWQDAPKIWGAIRKDIDDTGEVGQYLLTGSTSQTVNTPHTGTMRISRMHMLPMSLFELGLSNGSVSLSALFDGVPFETCMSGLDIDGIKEAICIGGWPRALHLKSKKSQLALAPDLLRQTCEVDISHIDAKHRSPLRARAILKSYARNICTLATAETIYGDVSAAHGMSKATYLDYVNALRQLGIIEDIEAWCPAIRSKSAIRSSPKRNLADPSIAAAALGVSPAYFKEDYKTLGFLFESLCVRDLKAYSANLGGRLSYYRDRHGLEADGVLHLEDGRYALLEFKLGSRQIDQGAEHLCEIERLVDKHNKVERQTPLRLPDLKIVITATEYGYVHESGVFVIPLACLRP